MSSHPKCCTHCVYRSWDASALCDRAYPSCNAGVFLPYHKQTCKRHLDRASANTQQNYVLAQDTSNGE